MYIPLNNRLIDAIDASKGRMRFGLCVSGVLLEQLARWSPEGLESFRSLVRTGCVELLGSLYYQAPVAQFSMSEFRYQARLHMHIVEHLFGERVGVFYHSAEPYDDPSGCEVAKLGCRGMIGAIPQGPLGGRSSHTVYQVPGTNMPLLPLSYSLVTTLPCDRPGNVDVSRPESSMRVSSVRDGVDCVMQELRDSADVVGLPFSYESQSVFGADVEALFAIVNAVAEHSEWSLLTPRECIERSRPMQSFEVPRCIGEAPSWALSGARYNRTQCAALRAIYDLIPDFRRAALSGSDRVRALAELCVGFRASITWPRCRRFKGRFPEIRTLPA